MCILHAVIDLIAYMHTQIQQIFMHTIDIIIFSTNETSNSEQLEISHNLNKQYNNRKNNDFSKTCDKI